MTEAGQEPAKEITRPFFILEPASGALLGGPWAFVDTGGKVLKNTDEAVRFVKKHATTTGKKGRFLIMQKTKTVEVREVERTVTEIVVE